MGVERFENCDYGEFLCFFLSVELFFHGCNGKYYYVHTFCVDEQFYNRTYYYSAVKILARAVFSY